MVIISNEEFISTRDLNEVVKIHSNPQYANYSFEYVDGEYRFYSPNYKKQNPEININKKEETYVSLEQLESLLSESGYMCYGHGTGRNADEAVDSIFNEGLRTKNNSLYYATIGLSTPTPELKEQFKEIGMPEPTIENLKKQFNNWRHPDSKKIIIARVPTEYINKLGDRSDLDGEMFGAFYTQKSQPNGRTTNYLDPKFIIGCYDVDKQAVRINKSFEQTLTFETIERLKDGYKKAVEKTKARKERQALGITQEEIDLARQNQQSREKYNVDSTNSVDDNISPEQEEINELKKQLTNYNNRIDILLANIQPYMQIPKVNREISKVTKKNDEINSSKVIESLQYYKTVVDVKKTLVSYLENAAKFIADNVSKNKEVVEDQQSIQPQNPAQSLPNDFWLEFEQPQQDQKPQQFLQKDFWKEFVNSNNNRNMRPERRYNSDGTFTIEYISYLANTPSGFNQTIFDQLMQENAWKRQQNQEQMTNGTRHI